MEKQAPQPTWKDEAEEWEPTTPETVIRDWRAARARFHALRAEDRETRLVWDDVGEHFADFVRDFDLTDEEFEAVRKECL